MTAAAPELPDISICLNNECPDGGWVIVIGHPGEDPKQACVTALKMTPGELLHANENDPDVLGNCVDVMGRPRHINCSHATLDHKDWSNHLKSGFDDDNFAIEESEDEERSQILAATQIMSAKLE